MTSEWINQPPEAMAATISGALKSDLREKLLKFCRWLEEGEFGEGHEEEIVDRYLTEEIW